MSDEEKKFLCHLNHGAIHSVVEGQPRNPDLRFKKDFTVVIYECNKLELFVPGKHLQPCLRFASEAGAYLSEASFRCSV